MCCGKKKQKTYRQSPSGGFHDDSDITEGAVWVMSGKRFRGRALGPVSGTRMYLHM